jgi:hypothetical protein
MKKVPPKDPVTRKVKTSSKRTCDLIAERTSFLQGVDQGSPEFNSRKALFQKEITASCRQDYRDHVDGVLEDMERCDDRGDSKGVQAGIHRLSGKKKKFCSKQPTRGQEDQSLALPKELAKAWGKFCEAKFAPTEKEEARSTPPPISPAVNREHDVPTDEELEFCLAALAKRKGTG